MFLDNTLKELSNSPFSNCNITILNNASVDNTLSVCNHYLGILPFFTILTNKINIGGDANILRAVETSNSEYTWILADDDEYDFSNCDDLINIILNGEVDLVHVGANTDVPWCFGGMKDIPRKLISKGYDFFVKTSFIPCNIFRTKEFYPYLINGYRNIANFYGHMPFLFSFFEDNREIYITRNQIVKRGKITINAISTKDYLTGWINTASLLKDKNDRKIYLKDTLFIKGRSRKIFYTVLLYILITNEVESPFYKMFYYFGPYVLLISILFLIPYSVFKLLKNFNDSYLSNNKHL